MTNGLDPYALIIAEVVNYDTGDLKIRLTDSSGKSQIISVSPENNITSLTKEQAIQVASQYDMELPD